MPLPPTEIVDGVIKWTDIQLPAGSVDFDEPFTDDGAIQIFAGGYSADGESGSGEWLDSDSISTTILVTSTDLTGYDAYDYYYSQKAVVNLSDIAAMTYATEPGAHYNYCFDFSGDGNINLSDIMIFTPDIGSTYGNGKVTIDPKLVDKALNGEDLSEETTFDSLKSMYR
jgi:hypothetical protein